LDPIIITVQYKIKKKKLAKAKNALLEYVDVVKKNELGTIDYKVFQDKDNPSSIIHLMSFVDKNAKKLHEKSEHLKKLKKILVPISKGKSVYTTMIEMESMKSTEKTEESLKNSVTSHEPI
jgi:quinol monooxygenase YgiN